MEVPEHAPAHHPVACRVDSSLRHRDRVRSGRSRRPALQPRRRRRRLRLPAGMLPTDADGNVVAGDIKAQTARALDNLAALPADRRLAMAQVAAVTVYLKNAADFAAMNEVYGKYWPKDPPTRTTVDGQPRRAGGAGRDQHGRAAQRRRAAASCIQTTWLRSPSPYSYGIRRRTRCSCLASSRATARTTPPCPAT